MTDISLLDTKATVELYKTDYTRIRIVPNLSQNLNTASADDVIEQEPDDQGPDDNDDKQDSFEPTGKYANGLPATQQPPSAADNSKRTHARLVWCMVALYAWLIFCIIYWLLGFSNWITTVSNTLFTAFFIYLVDFERRRINKNKE